MITLSVNLNKIALLRNSRHGGKPSVTDAAREAIARGAGGITVHPRPDQRHIRPEDVYALAQLLADDYPSVEFRNTVFNSFIIRSYFINNTIFKSFISRNMLASQHHIQGH